MTNEELVLQIQKGHTDKLEELWDQVAGLVKWKAGQVMAALELNGNPCGVEFDDLYQSGYFALVAAVEKYDPEAGAFSSWLIYHIKTAFAEATGYRTQRGRKEPINNATSLDKPLTDESDSSLLSDLIPDPKATAAMQGVEESLWREQLRGMVAMVMESLPDQQKEVLHRRFWMNQNTEKIGADMGISVNQTRNEEDKALRRLRRSDKGKYLRPFLDFSFYTGTGLGAFRSSGASIQERYLIAQENRAKPEET